MTLAEHQTTPWNVLAITSDEHNAKMLGCAGHPVVRTPNLDRLASEGTRFTKAYCAQPICAPTRQTFITGLYSFEHGQYGNGYVFDKRHPTWAHHFGRCGYTTGCIGKMHTNNEDYHYGFDVRVSRSMISDEIKARREQHPPTDDPHDKALFDAVTDNWGKPPRLRARIARDGDLEPDGVMTNEAIAFLRRHGPAGRKGGAPFFLHASLSQPHWPWVLPEAFYYMYDPSTIDYVPYRPGELDHNAFALRRRRAFGWEANTDEQNRLARARYCGAVSWLDHNVGRLLDTLDALGLAEHTLVVYFTDHGDMASEKGLWLKSLLYESSARVPLIMRMPGVIAPGAVNETLVNHADLFPTLAALAGTGDRLPERISGLDLSRCITDGTDGVEGPRFTIAFDGVYRDGSGCAQLMARSGQFKLIQYDVDDPGQRDVLYDLEDDPDETRNLADDPAYAEVVREHEAAFAAFFAKLRPPLFPVRLAQDDPQADRKPAVGRRLPAAGRLSSRR
ncbi:MAG: sulfatase-like hydrolase/transferase [Chloroflexi bacterium]|nr:sulfatase-like hydrolase/transferase [Chloroflexota bacterium]